MVVVRISIFLPFLLLTLAFTSVGSADDPRAEELYGDGVHAFYRGDYSRAIQSFDVATAYGSLDPRVYYFRGAAKMRQGRRDEARFDFQYGAQLEAAQGRTDVGRSLQRLQGSDRLLLEQYRRAAQQIAKLAPQPAATPTPPTPEATAAPPSQPKVTGRSVSEIPDSLRDLPDDPADPFADQAPGLLGRGELEPAAAGQPAGGEPVAPAATASEPIAAEPAEITGDESTDPFADENPFGGPPVTADSAAPEDDPFADNGSVFDDAASTSPAPESASQRGPLGAVFRALTRGAAANPALKQGQELLEGARDSLPGGAPPSGDLGSQGEDPFFEQAAPENGPATDVPFGEVQPPTTEPQPGPGDPEDPFGEAPGMAEPQPPTPADPDDPFGGDAAPAEAVDDPFAADSADDPFATEPPPEPEDEVDPFGDAP